VRDTLRAADAKLIKARQLSEECALIGKSASGASGIRGYVAMCAAPPSNIYRTVEPTGAVVGMLDPGCAGAARTNAPTGRAESWRSIVRTTPCQGRSSDPAHPALQ
jgi:hypothetical protein